jgi:endonuclease G, mitochondrial
MKLRVVLLLLSLTVYGCQSSFNSPEEKNQDFDASESISDIRSAEILQTQHKSFDPKSSKSGEIMAVDFTENFESGSKTSYTNGTVNLTTGSWYFADALLGTTSSDRKLGSKSARIRGNGYVEMSFGSSNGIGVVSLRHGKYGSDGTSTWVLQYSTNNGGTWINAGSAVNSTSTTLKTVNFTVNQGGAVRLRIQKTDGSSNRVNFDEIVVNDFPVQVPPTVSETEPNDNRASANPTGAVSSQTGLISVSTDVDYFSFSANSGQDIALSLEVPSGVDYDLYLVDLSGGILASSEASGNTSESISFVAPATSTFYAVVQPYNSFSAMNFYTVGVSVTGSSTPSSSTIFTEGFEGVSKGSYTTGTVTTASGAWLLNDALIGTLTGDKKNGSGSARLRNTGSLEMQFDNATGIGQIAVSYASYGTDASSNWQLEYSTNGGSSWTAVGSAISATATLTATTIDVNVTGNARIRFVKLSGGTSRLNFDDIQLSDYPGGSGGGNPGNDPNPTNSVHLTFGNPSDALIDIVMENNYLLTKDQYVMSYNRTKATANWVSWHIDSSWLGSAPRQDDFRADVTLPAGWYEAGSTSYSGSGFDRGHMCPSADRTATVGDNSATFLMSNMIPQSPDNNQGPWANMENGTGSNGYFTTINNGQITVPSRVWKVVIVLPQGDNDVSRVTTNTRVIAVDMPNVQGIRSVSWGTYRTTVDAIESMTGLDLLELINDSIEPILESQIDSVVL